MKNNGFLHKIKEFFIKGGNVALDLLYPENIKCIFCGVDIPDYDNKPYCDECEKKEIFNNSPNRCKFCDTPIYDESEICENCKNHHPVYQKACCPLLYKNEVRAAILKFKDDNAKYLAKPFAKLVCDRLEQENFSIDIILPVPSHKRTVKKRGYNQAQVLAEEIGKILNLPVKSDLIEKTKITKAQKSLDYAQRQSNLYKSFKAQNLDCLKDKNVLIVDDILTTGATVNAIARLIKKQAHNIYVACIARTNFEKHKHKFSFKSLFNKKS